MIQSHTFEHAGVAFHYAESQGAGLPLVILHGITGSHAEFLHTMPDLTRWSHVYAFDMRGHGRSGWPADGRYEIADYTGDVVAFLKQVVGQSVILLGHSLGGMVATWLAAHHPELLAGVILEDAGLYITAESRFQQSWFYPYFEAMRTFLPQYHANGAHLEEMVAYVGDSAVDDGRTWLDVVGPEAVHERALQLHQVDPRVLTPLFEDRLFSKTDPDTLLAKMRGPVHILAAQPEFGSALTPEDIERMRAIQPQATATVVKGAGHDVHLDRPQDFVRDVARFISAVAESV